MVETLYRGITGSLGCGCEVTSSRGEDEKSEFSPNSVSRKKKKRKKQYEVRPTAGVLEELSRRIFAPGIETEPCQGARHVLVANLQQARVYGCPEPRYKLTQRSTTNRPGYTLSPATCVGRDTVVHHSCERKVRLVLCGRQLPYLSAAAFSPDVRRNDGSIVSNRRQIGDDASTFTSCGTWATSILQPHMVFAHDSQNP